MGDAARGVREVDDVVAKHVSVDTASKLWWQASEEQRVWLRVGGDGVLRQVVLGRWTDGWALFKHAGEFCLVQTSFLRGAIPP